MFHKILLAVEGSTAARESSAVARHLAGRLGSEVLVVHVLIEHYSGVAAWTAEPSPRVEACLREVLEGMRSDGIAVRRVFAEAPHGHVGKAIADIAVEENVDLIVIGGKRRSTLEGFPLGSVAMRTLHLAPCPVLVVRDVDPSSSELHPGPAA